MNYEKAGESHAAATAAKNSIQHFWNERIMERFIKANLFIICCVAAGLLLIVYLGAFSCEVSWILEARGDLPYSAYILCTQFFVVFVATTILIHGLVTGLPWGLFAWSVVIGLLSIPELVFVMIMTTQHWGLQSVHGMTELISYLIRLVINCFALICVIPTGLKWRRETQVLSQLQDLATRLQLQTPPPSAPMTKGDSRRSSKRMQSGIENAGYQVTDSGAGGKMPMNGLMFNNNNPLFGSQNEFNASIFTPQFMQPLNNTLNGDGQRGTRAQSLMDLRCTLPGMYNPRNILEADDKNAKFFNITIDDLKNTIQDSSKAPSVIGSVNDPIYCSIEPKQPTPPPPRHQHSRHSQPLPPQHYMQQHQHHLQQQQQHALIHPQAYMGKLSRNCISLENLDGIAKVQNELAAAAYGHNLMQNYSQQQQYYFAMLHGYLDPMHASHLNIYRRPISAAPSLNAYPPAAVMGGGGGGGGQPVQRRNSQHMPYYGGFDYTNFTNPYITANSKLSLGNESDDYRKYRDVAL